ncbi:ribonuclease HI [Halobacteroides halobius DSM 5150]|uniref:Ribonuclease HI n=1 Tax=Halobacteroides halobius (strain ATCC 35273 / DSM 5150 / MD-1) TaxID=748449 RepID=L0K925_HALHC|nr:ribonuclease HI family protein [Halobacteroides halobius]AGB41777.1 ribonuclease HI [Halobacteroides halobius DSM 5150]
MANLTMYTDGGSRGNPGPAGVGAVIYNNGQKVEELFEYIGRATNNVAEYKAVILGLKLLADNYSQAKIEIKADSQLLVKQLTGEYKVKSDNLKPLYQQIKELITNFSKVEFTHIPREENKEADALANQAMDKCR